MLLNLRKNLDPIKNHAGTQVDEIAEQTRGRYITLGAGQAMVYTEKEREATMVSENPDISPSLVPHLATEAASFGISLFDQAVIVLTQANLWRNISSYIESKRLYTKAMIREASNPLEINDLVHHFRVDMEAI